MPDTSIAPTFFAELKRASNGQKSSLSWISIAISDVQPKSDFDYYIAVGGTDVFVYYKDVLIQEFRVDKKTNGVELLTKTLNSIDKINASVYLNFAYPISSSVCKNGISARLINPAKEYNFDDIINLDLVEIITKIKPNITRIQILNDTVSILSEAYFKDEVNACLILGTGFNIGLIYKNNIINLEAGNFNSFSPLQTTIDIDKNSNKPTTQMLEKEIAGQYLYQHYNLLTNSSDLNSSKQLAQIQDPTTDEIYKNIWLKTSQIKSAVEQFLLPKKTNWVYDGSLIKYLNQKF